jgi:prepilin-type N-terminal cleavage/methylation domain-containing protein
MMKYPDFLPSSDHLRRRERGYTLTEILVVIAIIGLMVTIGYPIMWRSLVRSRLLGEVRMIQQATAVARIHAVKNGQRVTLKILDDNAMQEGGLIEAWIDTDEDGVNDASTETSVGRWMVRGGVAGEYSFFLSPDSGNELFKLAATTARGAVFLPTGATIANSAGNIGVGQGAVEVQDEHSNRIRLMIRGGSGTVSLQMWNPDAPGADKWSNELRFWSY